MVKLRHALVTLLLVLPLFFAAGAHGTTIFLKARLDGAQAGVPTSSGDGSAFISYDDATGQLTWSVNYRGLSSAANAAHIHGPAAPGASAAIVVPFTLTASPITGSAPITPSQAADMLAGLWYVNIHSDLYPGGEIRGQISTIDTTQYKAPMDGKQAGTAGSPLATSGSGSGTVTFDPATLELDWNLSWANLPSGVTAAHFHGPAQPFEVAAVEVPSTLGDPMTGTMTLTPALAAQLVNGFMYFNIHTNTFPGGEIRGQVLPVQQLTVTSAGAGSGTVTSSNPPGPGNPGSTGIVCPPSCSDVFDDGSTVTLTAVSTPGSAFTGWSGGGCSGIRTCSVTLAAAANVTATFDLAPGDPPRLGAISTRMQVLTADNVLIGGFIIGGSTPKTVVVRARGPSLASSGISNFLANPVLQLVFGNGTVITNDDWGSAPNAAAISASGFAPSDPHESAILATLDPGPYTAIVSGAAGGTGVGIVEIFEVDHFELPLVGISTRGRVLTGNDVMIGGLVIQGNAPQQVVVRARGPSLTSQGVSGALANPILQLVASDGTTFTNDDWQSAGNAAQITTSGFAPADMHESAILLTLQPGAYTAIVSGVGGATGVGLVEVFIVP
jgi:hypothetical protein